MEGWAWRGESTTFPEMALGTKKSGMISGYAAKDWNTWEQSHSEIGRAYYMPGCKIQLDLLLLFIGCSLYPVQRSTDPGKYPWKVLLIWLNQLHPSNENVAIDSLPFF